MNLGKATWTMVEEYLKTAQTLIIPVGLLKYHDTAALLGTDYKIVNRIAKEVSKKFSLTAALSLNYGMANQLLGLRKS